MEVRNWAQMAAEIRRRGKEGGLPEKFSGKDCERTFWRFGEKCYACKGNDKLAIDHHRGFKAGIPLSEKSAVLLCRWCNTLKGARSPEDFYSADQLEELKEFYGIE